MKISVSSYSFFQYLNDGRMTQIDTVKKAAEMGFCGIEFTSLEPCQNPTKADKLEYAKKIKEEAKKYGIEIVAYCVGAKLYNEDKEAMENEVKRIFDEVDVAEALGVKIMRHDVTWGIKYGEKIVSFDRQLPVIAENSRKITEYAATKGIKTCSENHGFVAQDSERMERLYNAVGHDNYGLLVDIGNFACVDEDPAISVSRLAPYAVHVHAKDFYITKFGEENIRGGGIQTRGCNILHGSVVCEGNMKTEQCVAILKKAGYDGYLTIEYEGREDCLTALVRGLNNLQRIL